MAVALVGGAFLSAALQVLFDRLAPKAIVWDLFKSQNSNSKKLLKKLRKTLLFVSKVLADAEKKEITNRHVKLWLDDLKDIVYDADDLLAVIGYDSASADALAGTKFQEQLEEILERLVELKEDKDVLGLEDCGQKVEAYGHNLPLERRTTSLVDESEVHGREADKEAITRLLMSEETNDSNGLGVIAIVGMGGIGKTTLAQLVYWQKEVVKTFQLKAWICVSEETDIFLVTRNILRGFAPEVPGLESMTPDLLQTKLKDTLMGKRFFLVLDDVWDERSESWKILLQPLKHGLQGSRIIVTTRSNVVASRATTFPAYSLKKLSEDECWFVFARCAFRDEDPTAYPDLEAIGRKMAAECGGLPLAANALGSLLSDKRDTTEWERIMKCEIWNLEDRHILPALRLSYHYLSSSHKRCFAYCTLFPKDFEFEMDKLVRLWMADDIFSADDKGNRPMDEIGADCFGALLSRSFFQRSSVNSSCFVMHDLVHDLARSVAGDFYYRLENDNACLLPTKTRHLSYISARYNTSQKCAGIYQSKSLRSFFPLHRYIGHQYMDKDVVLHLLETSQCLRVLSLSNYVNIQEIPESIGNLKLLRYLDLSRTKIRRLPAAICKLCNLETLLLEDCKNLEEVPDSIVDLKCLQLLNLAGTHIKKLPTNLSNLVKLCALHIRRTRLREMPPKLGSLTRLQNLTDFFVGKGSFCSTIEELKELSKLKGKLCIWNLENVTNAQVASASNLKGKKHLRDLELSWKGDGADDSQQELKILEGLEPPYTLEHLTVRGYRSTKFPNWVGHHLFSNLVSLRIEECKNCYELPPLGHLESLKTLHISGCDALVIVGLSFYGSPMPATEKPPFKYLEALLIEDMNEWITWEQHDRAFPGLQELCLSMCPKLTNALPGELPSLKRLRITGCDQLASPLPTALAIVEVVLDDRNRAVNLNPHSGLQLSTSYNSFVDQTLGDIEQMGASVSDLKEVDISYSNLASGYQGTESCSPLEGVLEHFKCLDSLGIHHCPKVVSFLKCELASPTLTKLYLHDLENLKSLPEKMHSLLPCLVDLGLLDCPELELSSKLCLPSKLESLQISDCRKLVAGRKQWKLHALPSLSSLTIGGGGYSFKETESFPEPMLLPCTLTTLVIQGISGLKRLDEKGLQNLTNLQTLAIELCSSLEKLPEEGVLQSLTTLEIYHLPSLKSLSPIQQLTSLRSLCIDNCDEISLARQVSLPSTITSLRVWAMNIKSLDGWGLQRLTCLEELRISDCFSIESITEEALPSSLRLVELVSCANLRFIPRDGFPSSLERLSIQCCPLLAEKFQWEGEEWHLISHIPDIDIC